MSQIQTKEGRITLAIEAICSSKKISVPKAAELYNVPRTTLCDRMNGCTIKQEYRPVATLLTLIEEDIVAKKAIELDNKGFALSIAGIRDMVN